MATNEPMTDERLANMKEHYRTYGGIRMGELLAEVDRLRAEVDEGNAALHEQIQAWMSQKAENERLRAALEREVAENAAMRPVVEAVAAPLETVREHVCMCDVPYDGPHESQCMVAMARAFVAAHPATDTATAGEAESEGE